MGLADQLLRVEYDSCNEDAVKPTYEPWDTNMRHIGFRSLILFAAFFLTSHVQGVELSPGSFADLQKLIKPQSDESLWRHGPWETNLHTARQRAAAEGKPLLIWAGGGSAPLGGC